MTIADIEEQLRATYWDWDGFLVNPRFARHGSRVAWNRYSIGIIREPISHEKVRSLVETKQYSFQCAEDGSIFQLLYEFDSNNNVLQLARLAFYQSTLPLIEEDSGLAGPLPDFSDIFIPWMRFDYTQQYAAGVLHHESHLHVSGFANSRFVVNGVPGPRQFVEFVIAACYSEYYKIHRLRDDGSYSSEKLMQEVNICCHRGSSDTVAGKIIHLHVP